MTYLRAHALRDQRRLGSQDRTQFSANGGAVKKNCAMVSSKPSSSITPPGEPKSKGIYIPTKRQRPEETSTFIKPIKRRAEAVQEKEEDSDSDDDFRTAQKLVMPVARSNKVTNPFKKPPRTAIKKEGALYEIDDTEDLQETRPQLTLKKPKKKQDTKTIEQMQQERENEKLLNSLKRAHRKEENEADKKKCPYCAEILYPMTDAIANALKEIEIKDEKHKQKEMKEFEKENSTSEFSTSINMIRKRKASWSEKDAFCTLHNIELNIKPDGINEGYPTTIDFDDLKKRIPKFDEELKSVIRNEIMSDYRDIAEQAYKDEGITKARSTLSVMSRFQKTLPGYYGPKGAAVILGVLSQMYLKTGYLEKHLVSQQLPLEFLQQVLVPEVGFRLILQDIIRKGLKGNNRPPANSKEKAKKIMLESIEYGSAIFPTEDAKIEDSNIDNPIKFFAELDSESDEEDANFQIK